MALQELIPLGTNGFFPSFARQTMSFLVLGKTGDGSPSALLLDAGSGIGRLMEPVISEKLSAVARLDVILTHYHLDHVCGLPALPTALAALGQAGGALGGSPPELFVWAPGAPLVDATPRAALQRLLSPPLFPSGLDTFLETATLQEYSEARQLEQIPLLANENCGPITIRRQHHSGGSVGLRFANQLAYITDTRVNPDLLDRPSLLDQESSYELACGIDLLLHEVWVSAEQAKANSSLIQGHTDAGTARRLAEGANVRRFMPVHHHPTHDQRALQSLHSELISSSYELLEPVEGRIYSLSGGDP